MEKRDLNAMVISDTVNVRYIGDLRNFGAPELYNEFNLVVLNQKKEVYAYSQVVFDGMKERMPWTTDLMKLPAWQKTSLQEQARSDLIIQALSVMDIPTGRIGIDFLPFQVKDALQAKSGNYQFVSVASELLKARMVKTEDEIKLMEVAAANNEIGMKAGLDAMQEGASEYDVIAATIGAMAEAGIEGLTHYPICRSGERTLHDFVPIGRRLRKGDTVILDIGNYGIGGYACDFCRTGIVGKPSDAIRKCYEVLHTSHMEGIQAVKPGVMASDINEVINRSLRKAGFPESAYANGHGIGMGIMELPTIANKNDIPEDIELREGMTICLEPITYGVEGAVKVEDVVLVTATGSRVLTRTDYLAF
jgi:Xaa-Pro aminopeptidase